MGPSYEKQVAGPPNTCAVCGVTIKQRKQVFSREYLGEVYAFCSEACLGKFVENPKEFSEEDDEDE